MDARLDGASPYEFRAREIIVLVGGRSAEPLAWLLF